MRVGSAVQLECGSLWFTDGIDLSLTVRDELRAASPALAFFGAIAIGAYAAYTFSEALETRWVWAAITVLFVACGIASAFVNIARRDRATARMELGTLLLDDFFAYLSHGRAVAIPRSGVIRTALQKEGGASDRTEVRVVYFRGPDGGERVQRISGFFRDEVGVEQLRRWISNDRR